MEEDKSWVESTTRTPTETVNMLILQKREIVIRYLKDYHVSVGKGNMPKIHYLRASIISLFDDLEGSLLEDNMDITELERLIYMKDYESLRRAFRILNSFLYKKGVTRFDNVEEEGHAFMSSYNDKEVFE